MLLALDPATILGWACAEPGGEPSFGSQRMGPLGSGFGIACAALHEWLDTAIARQRPTHLIYERPYIPVAGQWQNALKRAKAGLPASATPPMNADTVFKLAAFAGIIEMAAVEEKIPVYEVTAQQAAKHFTGKGRWGGRAEKKRAVVEMAKRYGWEVADDNAADALAILMTAEAVLFPAVAAKRKGGAGPLFAAPPPVRR